MGKVSTGTQIPPAVLDGFEAEADGEMSLAHPGRAEDHHVLTVLDEVAATQGLKPLFATIGACQDAGGVR